MNSFLDRIGLAYFWEKIKSAIDSHANNKNNPHNVTASQVGAAPSSHKHTASDITSGIFPVSVGGTGSGDGKGRVTFVNADLNAVNIDNDFSYNYTTSIAVTGYDLGTTPYAGGWWQIINFYAVHFVVQIAVEISNSTVSDRPANMWIRQRYVFDASCRWSNWTAVMDRRKFHSSTSDLVSGSSSLADGEFWFVYE